MTMTNIYNWENIAPLARLAHEREVAKGFWDEPHSEEHCLMLVITKLSEAVAADCLGKWARIDHDAIDTLERIEGETYAQMYLRYVKDTVECKLSNACIRLLDLLGANIKHSENICITPYRLEVDEDTLPTSLFCVCDYILIDSYIVIRVKQALCMLRAVADHYGIDLMAHVELKLKYNATRPALHGKKY